MFGLLNLHKPAGMTSRDAVNRVQRIVRVSEGGAVKVGHAGTLDPIATGVLVLCLGPATRLIERIQQMPKRYVGTFTLGCTSPSDDIELTPEPIPDAPVPTLVEIEAVLPAFVGDIQQVPPAYSAIKIKGQKAYRRVRRGELVEMQPRPVTIYGINLVRYEYPELVLDIRCGSGTYIRSLGRDLASSIGTGAVMSGLERTEIGSFRIEEALPVDQVTAESIAACLRSPLEAMPDMPRCEVTTAEEALLRRGMPIPAREDANEDSAAVNAEGLLVALLQPKRGELWPVRVFAA